MVERLTIFLIKESQPLFEFTLTHGLVFIRWQRADAQGFANGAGKLVGGDGFRPSRAGIRLHQMIGRDHRPVFGSTA